MRVTATLIIPQTKFKYRCQEVERDMRPCPETHRAGFSGKGEFEPRAEG